MPLEIEEATPFEDAVYKALVLHDKIWDEGKTLGLDTQFVSDDAHVSSLERLFQELNLSTEDPEDLGSMISGLWGYLMLWMPPAKALRKPES